MQVQVCALRSSALPARTKVRWYGAVKTHIVLEHDVNQVSAQLDEQLLDFINRSDAGDDEFDRLALELFAYQFGNNVPYRNLCELLGRTPATVASWRDVPAVSVASFAEARIACFPRERTRISFVSSGTSSGGRAHSTHELENTLLYDASLTRQFKRCVLPDREKIRMLLLSPSFEESPHSSLAYMLSKLYELFNDGGSFFIRDGKLDTSTLIAALRESKSPTLVFGTAFAFVHFLDYCTANGLGFSLAAGSRVVETGGFKGKSRSVDRDELYAAMSQTFGVPQSYCLSEYGMCELGSQWYDGSLLEIVTGRKLQANVKIGPHWTRTLVVDPVTAQIMPDGATGLLQCFDLSNRGSVAAVLTGDLASLRDGGFVYQRRSPAAPPKGCSITIDSLLRSNA